MTTGDENLVRVLKGCPTDEEIVAVIAVVLACAGPAAGVSREVGSVRRHRTTYGSPIGWAS